MKRLLDHNPLTGITEWFESTDDGFVVRTEQDAEPIIELNKQKRSLGRAYYAEDPNFWRVASIPIGIQYEWLVRFGIDDVTAPEHWPRVRRLLNDPDYRYLKTAEIII